MEVSRKTLLKFSQLIGLLKNKSSLLIVMQDNPDPDSIAAAIALRKLANAVGGLKCSITHGGTIGRGENRALVRYLNLNTLQCKQVNFKQYDMIAIVDEEMCVCCELCVDDCPDVFEVVDDVASVKVETIPDKYVAIVHQIAFDCPTEAICIKESNSENEKGE